MTKQEFRQQLEQLLYRQFAAKDEQELALIKEEIVMLRRKYKLSLVEQMRKNSSNERKQNK